MAIATADTGLAAGNGPATDDDAFAGPIADGPIPAFDSRLAAARRPLLIGGAITSAALSLAGVAWVAWRVARTPGIGEIEGTA